MLQIDHRQHYQTVVTAAAPELAHDITHYFEAHIAQLTPRHQFHFYNRLWLWTGSPKASGWLAEYRHQYTGNTDTELRTRLAAIAEDPHPPLYKWAAERAESFAQYPQLWVYNRLLFFTLFAETIYQTDLSSQAATQLPRDILDTYQRRLYGQPAAIATLSTHAVNFCYLTAHWHQETAPDPDYFYQIAQTHYNTTQHTQLHLQLYLLTHCLIGASRFYARPLPSEEKVYQQLLLFIEQQIICHYDQLSLDIKFEFLVCAALAQYATPLRGRINQEALLSISPSGTYLVDTLNENRTALTQPLIRAEHRNVLFIMANLPFVGHTSKA